MNNGTLEEQRIAIARLSGQAMALQIAVQALIANHPQREEVGRQIDAAIQGVLDLTLPVPVPEEALTYLDRTRADLMRMAQAR